MPTKWGKTCESTFDKKATLFPLLLSFFGKTTKGQELDESSSCLSLVPLLQFINSQSHAFIRKRTEMLGSLENYLQLSILQLTCS